MVSAPSDSRNPPIGVDLPQKTRRGSPSPDGQGYRNPTTVFLATIYGNNGMVCCESFP